MKIGALSGSITKTNDGLSYLVAGTNVTISSASNGSITISSTGGGGGTPGGSDTQVQYNSAGSFAGSGDFTYDGSLQITGSLIQANNGANTIGFMGNEVGSSPVTVGSDIFFFVSGSRNSEVASFGGDLVVSGTISIGGDSLEVTGTISATQGFSGSLTQLVDGTSYLVAGTNITITSASNGSVTVDAVGGTPGGSDTQIQYNSGGAFAGNSSFTYSGTTVHLTGSLSNGDSSVSHGQYSHAEGTNTNAYGYGSHAEGYFTSAGAAYAHAEGFASQAYGQGAHGEGASTSAGGSYSHSEGAGTTAISNHSHAEGEGTSSGYKGFNTTNITAGVVTLNSSYGDVTTSFIGAGDYALLTWTNEQDIAYEISSVTWNGTNTIVTLVDTSINDVRPGLIGIRGSTLPGSANATTSGVGSHAEGFQTYAQPRYSHAEGYQSLALAVRSHAEGESTTTIGIGSHSEGLGTIASGSYQHVGGKFNIRNNDFSLLVVGNGTSDADVDRSDIFRVNTDSVQVSGSLIVSGAYIHNVVSGTTAPNYVVGTWDHVIVFSNNVVTATLPPAAPIGRKLIFKDGTGAASTAGGQMLSCSLGAIDGSSTYTMASVNYTAVSVIKINDPDEWIIV